MCPYPTPDMKGSTFINNPLHKRKQVSTNTFTNSTPNPVVSNDAKGISKFSTYLWKELKNHGIFLENGLKSCNLTQSNQTGGCILAEFDWYG